MLVSTRDFVTRLSESGLSVMLPPDMAAELLNLPTAEAAARKLVDRNLLTEFQAKVLADGDNVPLIIGDYVVVGSLGRGGMGYVLKARHRRMKRDVAIKFLLKELTASTDMRRRFEREVEAAAQLNHQNIVTAYDAGEHTDGSCYLVMQFVDGDDLSHLVKANGPLKLPQAIDIICQAAEGLAFAHDKGIVHRDIKPGNLLLDKDGVVRILDMGLARMRPSPGDSIEGGAHADLTNTGSVMGTIDYMAPEQALDAKSADHRADIYSLGCTLWFLLSGNPPYRSDTIMRRLLAHREQQIPSVRSLWPDAPSELDDIFKSMMAKSKEDRFPSMRHLIVALRGLDKEDLEVGQMATMDVAEESAFSAQRSKNERFRPPSSPTAPLALSEQQIKGAKPALPEAVPADPTVIQNGDSSSSSETATFSNNESRVARRPRKKTARAAGSSRSAVVQTPTKSPMPTKRVALIAGVSILVITLAAALWSTRKPAAPTNNSTEIAQTTEGQQPDSSSIPVTPQPAVPTGLDWALKFDGKQSHVRTPLVHGGDTPLTIEFTLLPGPKHYAVISDSEGSGMGIDILNNSISFLAFRRNSGKADYVRITSPKPLADDRAYRIATVYDSGKLRLFVDGKLEASGELKGEYLPSNLPFYLGASPEEEGIDYPFTGTLDEVRFSKVARYQADYTPVARQTTDADTLALYHFDEGTGDELKDTSGSNRHGKILGAEWVKTDGSATTLTEQLSDRYAAEWIIKRGGAVYLNHSNTKFENLTDLPSGKIEVRAVELKKRLPEADVDIDAIRGLTHLEWVTLDMTQATPKAIGALEQATKLKRVSLGGFAVTDAHLATLARLPKLNGLFLAGSRLTSQQCRTLVTMPGLEKLNLTANPLIDDSSVESLSQLRNLTVLELNGTKVTATGLASLQRALPNCDIRWDGPSLKTIEQIDSTSKPWIDWLGPKLKRNEIYGGGWVREGNAFTTEKVISGVAIQPDGTRNGALRVTYLLRGSKGVMLNARDRLVDGKRVVYVAEDTGTLINVALVREGSKYDYFKQHTVPASVAKDAPRTLEFRVIGDALTASFNNSVIATVKDATVPDGNFALVALKGVLIQKVEYQALDGSGVDLLQKIGTARDGIGSSWKMSNGTLQTIAGPGEGDRRLFLPIENAPNEYDIRLKVQRASPRDNALMLGMVTGGRRVGLVIDGFKSRGGLWGLEQIDGKGPPDNGTAVPNEPLKVDAAADVLVQVRKTGIRVERDGKQLINWIGSPEKLSLNAKWDDKGPPRFFLGAQGDFTIHQLTFEPIQSSETTWLELFNGKDLAGWEVMGVKGWSVEQGVLLGKTSTTSGNGWLMSERQFGDFELELEYKLSPGSNSGIFLRAWPEGAINGNQFREIQLLDDEHPMFASVSADRRSGSVFGVVAPNTIPKLPADQWHRVRVHLRGQQLQLTINDVAVLKHTFTDLRPSGRIGLQLYPNRVEFRNIRVRPAD